MPSKLRFVKYLVRNWHIKILSLLTAVFVWIYVNVKDKVPFQVELPIRGIPQNVEVYPKKVLVTGQIAEKLHTREVLNCFEVSLMWNKGEKYATVVVKPPLPSPFVEIDGIFPQRVEVKVKQNPKR